MDIQNDGRENQILISGFSARVFETLKARKKRLSCLTRKKRRKNSENQWTGVQMDENKRFLPARNGLDRVFQFPWKKDTTSTDNADTANTIFY